MTLEEVIKYAEEVAEEQEKAAKEWHENQVRKCELFPFTEMDYTHENECKKCAKEHRQLAEWLKELKELKEQTRWISCSERLPKPQKYGDKDFSDWVQITLRIQENNNVVGRAYYCFSEKEWYLDNRLGVGEVIAWMPLPKPYESQKSEVE